MAGKAVVLLTTVLWCSTILGGAGTSVVTIQTSVATMPPGTAVHVEMTARYAIIDAPRKADARKDGSFPQPTERPTIFRWDLERFSVNAPDVLRWDFVVGPDGSTPPRTQTFHFTSGLHKAPEGKLAVLLFPTKYKIECPAAACRSREEEMQFGMMLLNEPGDSIARCLQVRNVGSADGVVVGVFDDCQDFREKNLVLVPRS